MCICDDKTSTFSPLNDRNVKSRGVFRAYTFPNTDPDKHRFRPIQFKRHKILLVSIHSVEITFPLHYWNPFTKHSIVLFHFDFMF